jgi:hypothetical protein
MHPVMVTQLLHHTAYHLVISCATDAVKNLSNIRSMM